MTCCRYICINENEMNFIGYKGLRVEIAPEAAVDWPVASVQRRTAEVAERVGAARRRQTAGRLPAAPSRRCWSIPAVSVNGEGGAEAARRHHS